MTITREEAINVLKGMKRALKERDFRSEHDALNIAIKTLNDRPNGKWINSKTAKGYVACSNCNKLTTNINRKKYNYCPFCGTRMKGEVM